MEKMKRLRWTALSAISAANKKQKVYQDIGGKEDRFPDEQKGDVSQKVHLLVNVPCVFIGVLHC